MTGSERAVALVTGASSGIGAVFARTLAAIGYDVILVARRKRRLDELARDLRMTYSVEPEVIVADLATDEGVRLVEERIAATPNLEFLINNAGFATLGRFWDTDVAGQDAMLRLHVLATMRLSHAALKIMVPRKLGAIVNVASVAGFAPAPGNACYGSSKGWIHNFTVGLHLELRSAGSPVQVQSLCPGFTYSEFHDVLGVDRSTIPSGWWTTAEQVVEASFAGLSKGKLMVVPGGRYKVLTALLKWVPRPLYQMGAIMYSRRMRREYPASALPPVETPELME
ncbi:MAG TPA: SDR family oxidoreductase [Bryobacteraceae bacterium]|nr:SDR family oxidoreductase [Bryobacteraceae bacterium]